ncbi:MAG: amidase [Bosea sp. (in: a-proteobacteria)]|uniref:amidase n=1 Tax=Bosea sp. (in: a-proteobacteria) TaxID=1871050 RepID=UPI002732C765|nr:amidase [Bosea sp. (in: a-proteobacteria)]MDP3602676.1 amidase [Bosea sp. (in: a-proteobacteria)]
MYDIVNAFVPGTLVPIAGKAGGPLDGLSFAVKDLFDVAGLPTGGGNHDWALVHPVPNRHGWAVQTLLDAGASFVGKTITDEVSLGILGENAFDGTPINTAAPERVPGGSSSGSAAAVAAGLCDTALGTDTGGSVRVPASFCGLYGIRPTHGRVDTTGMLPQAPSSDTTGWFARDAETFARVSTALLSEAPGALPTRLLIATDAFAFADPEVTEALQPVLARLSRIVGEVREEIMAPQGLSVWARAQRTLQPVEAWNTFRHWVETANPRMAFSVVAGLLNGARMPEGERQWAEMMRLEARARLRHLLPAGTILCLPTTAFPAPLRGLSQPVLQPLKDRISCLCAQGGLTGSPQVSLPGATVNGAPVGLSIIGGRGTDATLIAVARAMGASA